LNENQLYLTSLV